MFIETIIATLAIGAIAGAVLYELLVADPIREERQALALRLAERRWADDEEARNLARYRKHLGTPYRPETVTHMTEAGAVALAHDHLARVMDDHLGSRKAPELRSVS
jgi:hypothetical protein